KVRHRSVDQNRFYGRECAQVGQRGRVGIGNASQQGRRPISPIANVGEAGTWRDWAGGRANRKLTVAGIIQTAVHVRSPVGATRVDGVYGLVRQVAVVRIVRNGSNVCITKKEVSDRVRSGFYRRN